MAIVCEKKQERAGSVSLNIKNATEFDCVLTIYRLLFFENVSKPGEEAFYSEGDKWEALKEGIAKHGFVGGMGGFFIKEKIQITHANIIPLLSFAEALVAECDKLNKDNSKFDYSGGNGLLLPIDEFLDKVKEEQAQIEEKISLLIEREISQQLEPFILLQCICSSRGYKVGIC